MMLYKQFVIANQARKNREGRCQPWAVFFTLGVGRLAAFLGRKRATAWLLVDDRPKLSEQKN